MSEDRIQELIIKYLSNTLSSEEWQELDEWYKSIGDQADPIASSFPDEDDLHIPVDSRLSQVMESDLKKQNRTRYYGWTAAIAATIVFVMGIALFLSPFNNETNKTYSLHADLSETRFVLLPDSSKVLLRPGSYMEVNYTTKQRVIKLVGEAFFDVTKQVNRPFLVYSGKFSTKVLGTKFVVKPNGNGGIMVSVQSGKVSVKDEQTKRQIGLLNAHEGVKISTDTLDGKTTDEIIQLSEQSANEELAWVDHEMVFRATQLAEVISKLETRYGVKILLVDPELNQRRITGQFNGTETIENVLETLTSILGAQYRLKDNTYQIY